MVPIKKTKHTWEANCPFLFKKFPSSLETEYSLLYLQVPVTCPSLTVVDFSACCNILFVSDLIIRSPTGYA